jgi:pimeloyl-ACP methyl ester carboxylesterase/DNA-binding CsgD family transcriptional regulator
MTGVGPPHPDILTPAEWDILGYLRRGMSNRQIANTRNSSVAAVKYHITNIRLKLTMTERDDLMEWSGFPSIPATAMSVNDDASIPLKHRDFREEEVRFHNGEVALAGTLVLPNSDGPHPAIIYTHGSGPQSRDHTLDYAKLFARHGIAGLVYDKRGVGGSSGDWVTASFDELVDDALSGLDLLQARDEISGSEVGVWGGSQGGWLGPLAASRSEAVAFIIAVSAPGVSPHEQNLLALQNWSPHMGIAEESFPAFLDAYNMFTNATFDFMATGEGWDELESAFSAYVALAPYEDGIPQEVLEMEAEVRRTILEPFVKRAAELLIYDPVPTLEAVTCPVLAIWGGQDSIIPVEKSCLAFEQALKNAANPDYTLKVFPDADHGMSLPDGARVPGYEELMVNWLLERVTVGP